MSDITMGWWHKMGVAKTFNALAFYDDTESTDEECK